MNTCSWLCVALALFVGARGESEPVSMVGTVDYLPECPAPLVYTDCGSSCNTCENQKSEIFCADVCDRGCFCPKGTYQKETSDGRISCVKDCDVEEPQCKLPLVYSTCGSGCNDCANDGDCLAVCLEGCFCPPQARFKKVNEDGRVECLTSRDQCKEEEPEEPCDEISLFCIFGQQCACAWERPVCSSRFPCFFPDVEGCYVKRPEGCRFTAPCPRDEAVFDDDAPEFCAANPGASYCNAKDCNSCFCEENGRPGGCTEIACLPPQPENGRCVRGDDGCTFVA